MEIFGRTGVGGNAAKTTVGQGTTCCWWLAAFQFICPAYCNSVRTTSGTCNRPDILPSKITEPFPRKY